MFAVNFVALVIARIRGLGPLNFDKAANMWGTSDKACQVVLWLALIGQIGYIIAYIVSPGQLINDTPRLEMSDTAQRFAQGVMFFSIAWVSALLYQLRTGYSMSLIVTSVVISTLFFVIVCNNAAMGGEGNPTLALTLTANFIGSLILFFRLESNH